MANNVINAVFSSATITYTKPAYQYDYGMILKFSGIELPQAYEVHFSNTEFCGESISQIGDADGVTIPDEMFLSGAPIYAWTFLHTGEDDGETVYKTVISINKRAQPSDIEPTPVQQDVITQAIAALNTAVEQTAADVVASGENAQAAAGSAEAAGQAKDDAAEAKDKAVEAKNAAETAQGKAEDAQRAAEQTAGSVLGLTADASVDANVGTPSVDVVVTEESDHKKMTFTFRNLKGVQGNQGIGIASVVLNADYTLTINLTNGTSYTTSSIRGEVGATPNLTIGTVSTLPEGSQATATITGTDENPVLNLGIPVGDTGVGIASVEKTGTSGLVDTYTITYTDGTTSTFEVTNGQDGEVTEDALEERLIDKADVITSSASGEIVTIADGGDDLPVVDLKLSLLPVQSGSGDPSPDNVRQISGWTGVEVYQRGFNLCPTELPSNFIHGQLGSYTIKYATNAVVFAIPVPKNTNICVQRLSTDGTGGNIALGDTDALSVGTAVYNKLGFTGAHEQSFNTGSHGYVYIQSENEAKARALFTTAELMISLDSGRKPYVAPKQGTTIPIDWTDEAGTVYGCNLSLSTGVLTVTDAQIASYAGETLPSTWISDRDVYAPGTTPTIGAQVVYKLETPLTFQLSKNQIATFLGTNNFWSNSNGQIDLEYRCDTKLYIEQLTKPSEDDMTANANIASGRFFMVNNRLFLSSVAIGQGETIIPGTNCTEVSLADALNTINS